MTKAKITKPDGYKCCPEGHTAVLFPFGAVVDGQVAKWALEDKAASRMFDKAEPLENKMDAPDENKAPAKRRGRPRKEAN